MFRQWQNANAYNAYNGRPVAYYMPVNYNPQQQYIPQQQGQTQPQQQYQTQGQPMQNGQYQQQYQQPQAFIPPLEFYGFANEEEVKSFLISPMKNILFINPNKKTAYVKSADAMGQSFLQAFTYSEIMPAAEQKAESGNGNGNGNQPQQQTQQQAQNQNQQQAQPAADYATKDEIKGIGAALIEMQKQLTAISNATQSNQPTQPTQPIQATAEKKAGDK